MEHTLPSGGDLKKAILGLGAGDVLSLAPGGRYKPAYIVRKSEFTLRGNGALIEGDEHCLKFEGCNHFSVEHLVVTRAKSNGLMVVDGSGVTLSRIFADQNGLNGILTANVSVLLIQDCEASNSRRGHGIYCSQSGDQIAIENCHCVGNMRCGIQVNAIQPNPVRSEPRRDNRSDVVRIQDCLLEGNQKAGAATINLAGVHGAKILRNRLLGMLGRHGIAAWDDQTNDPRNACSDVLIEGNEFAWAPSAKAQAWISVGPTCRMIQQQNNSGPATVPQRIDG